MRSSFVATHLDPLSSPSGIRFAPRPGHTSFEAIVHGASSIFCSPKKRNPKKGSPPRAFPRCQSRLPRSVRATSCGAHLDWPSLANRSFQSRLTAARVKGTWPDGSLGFRPPPHRRCRRSRRAVSVFPLVPPEHRRPGRIRPAGAGQGWPALAARRDASANPRPGREAQESAG